MQRKSIIKQDGITYLTALDAAAEFGKGKREMTDDSRRAKYGKITKVYSGRTPLFPLHEVEAAKRALLAKAKRVNA